jgi:outer membrane biosynthesis protein TonB
VNVDGSILSAQVVQSTQNTQSIPMLDQIVTKHIMTTWRFRPIQGVQCFFQPFELTS